MKNIKNYAYSENQRDVLPTACDRQSEVPIISADVAGQDCRQKKLGLSTDIITKE